MPGFNGSVNPMTREEFESQGHRPVINEFELLLPESPRDDVAVVRIRCHEEQCPRVFRVSRPALREWIEREVLSSL